MLPPRILVPVALLALVLILLAALVS